ncbi:glycosyltransferase WbsX family protein [Cellulomonas chengniuliangii]|uniref:Glycoside hydrolase family 99-like domain-containing protein n=1 Tax=Cellulomonas chengniuliangii TaxID=2968084 RepID=A0ABY5L1Z0_9CELL|nr:glycoside hydrolase family 99-like domain-containing protein [Cellulomonas chengniuliangii]MCC2307124.1 glycoside hydrolase family 99-like domain-containing protein [Cellulomonas chengniuliangii]UUI76078.1 glycoside hydrolase family 99-like domain-containing protein [Cellulomonas chengniuliangii]
MTAPRARAVAFYLPQYHPVPENDEWWGAGFTEWTNTARARPLFPGHRQPTLPADLGFYDLRLPEARAAQSAMAREHGVEAFVYWHYWFGNGSRILERPFAEVLKTGEPDISFCLAWANQTWSGIWHGARDRVLKEQLYPGLEDERAHFEAVLPAFRDDRYLRVDDRPVFYVFRPEDLPDAAGFVDRWQEMARRAGLPGLYLVAEVADLLGFGPKFDGVDSAGFDAGAYIRMPVDATRLATLRMRAGRKLLRWPEIYRHAPEHAGLPAFSARLQPSVFPNWDNTPRSGRRGLAITGSSPEVFERHVRQAVASIADRPAQERFLWVKSWNEWAEGNHLEPDLRHGRGWLEALREGVAGG